jgi:TP901 family phage tail tape measure protein
MNNVFRIQALMTLGDFISGPIESIRRSFQACAKDSEGLAGRIEALGKRFDPFAVVAGLVIGGMTATALATAETSEALGELATLGTNDLEMFRAKAMQVSNEWAGVTTPNFIKSAYAVTSAFSDLSEQAQADITEMASIASVATKASAEDMTEFIGKAYNIMGKSAEFKGLSEVQKVVQIFAGMSGSVREFMTTGPAMKQSLMAMGNSATLAGLGISDQLSALGLLSNMMEASVAGTGFKTFVNKLPQVSKELGLNFKDASGQMLPLADIIETITRKVGGLSSNASQIKVISLFGEEGANAFKSLSDNSEKLRNKR